MRARSFVVLLVTIASSSMVGLASCNAFDQTPPDTAVCSGAELTTPALDQARGDCIACIEDKQCCDRVGRCGADTACAKRVADTQLCVVSAGVRANERESACKETLSDDQTAIAAYDCMRAKCGSRCGLPVCTLDPAVGFIATKSCDRCFGLSCCNEFNACAKNRACKLALSCIVNECRSELSVTLAAAAADPSTQQAEEACRSGQFPRRPENDDDAGDAPTCTLHCLETFLGSPDGGADFAAELREGLCLALRVRSCGARANCGPECVVGGAGDAGDRD